MPRAHLNMKANRRTTPVQVRFRVRVPGSELGPGKQDLKDEDILHLLQLCVKGEGRRQNIGERSGRREWN